MNGIKISRNIGYQKSSSFSNCWTSSLSNRESSLITTCKNVEIESYSHSISIISTLHLTGVKLMGWSKKSKFSLPVNSSNGATTHLSLLRISAATSVKNNENPIGFFISSKNYFLISDEFRFGVFQVKLTLYWFGLIFSSVILWVSGVVILNISRNWFVSGLLTPNSIPNWSHSWTKSYRLTCSAGHCSRSWIRSFNADGSDNFRACYITFCLVSSLFYATIPVLMPK